MEGPNRVLKFRFHEFLEAHFNLGQFVRKQAAAKSSRRLILDNLGDHASEFP